MDVGFYVFRRLNLDNEVNVGDIQASGSYVGCYEHVELAFSEPAESDFAL